MDNFFCRETLKFPPELSKNGEIQSGDKAELLKCLRNTSVFSELQTFPPIAEVSFLDGLIIVSMTIPPKNQTFKMNCKESFTLKLRKYSGVHRVQRIDLVLDTYNKVSLEAVARRNHGKRVRRKVKSVL